MDLILGAYKEPLRKVENGFGYMGAVSFDKEGRIQCHICGKLFDSLSFHLQVHKIKVKDYRLKYGLSPSTSLISEKAREIAKERFFKMNEEKGGKEWFARLSRMGVEARKNKKYNGFKGLVLEQKNLRGICPDQLLVKIQECATALGHTPSYDNFLAWAGTERFFRPIQKTFGSWSSAIKKAGLTPKPYSRKGLTKWEDEELLELLYNFYNEHGNIPSRSDFARGLLPHYTVYINRFGSMPEARRKAHIPDWETHHTRKKTFLHDRLVKI